MGKSPRMHNFFVMIVFFFSSRRRHTRLQGDWSSDVCSSDLGRARVLLGVTSELSGRTDQRGCGPDARVHALPRSEEHTSELQSPCNLVCRLLLEKKMNLVLQADSDGSVEAIKGSFVKILDHH